MEQSYNVDMCRLLEQNPPASLNCSKKNKKLK